MEIIQYTIVVIGKVQGVWFRKFTKDQADILGINGTVKNLPDKSVYISAEGTKEHLEKFVEKIRKGSPLSKVNDIIIELGNVFGYQDFSINR